MYSIIATMPTSASATSRSVRSHALPDP